jgi:4'-phosphopantetheinyl transferase
LQILEQYKDQFLSSAELSLAHKLSSERRRCDFLLGRYCAKRSISALLGEQQLASIDIAPGVFNQPVVRGIIGQCNVSIAHAPGIAAALAFDCAHPMGLDIERLDSDNVSTIESQLTSHERILVDSCSLERVEAHFVLWTMKEALAKILLTGLMTPLSIYEVDVLTRQKKSWRGTFKNFAQYHAAAVSARGYVVSLAFPRRTVAEVAMLRKQSFPFA